MEVRFETLDGQLVEQAVLKEDKKNYPLLKRLTLCMVIHIINIVDRATALTKKKNNICGCSLVVKQEPSKLWSRVRFSSPAPCPSSSAG